MNTVISIDLNKMNRIKPDLRLDHIDDWCTNHFGHGSWQPSSTHGFIFFNKDLISMFLMEWGHIVLNDDP